MADDLAFRLSIKETEFQHASTEALSLVTRLLPATPEMTRGGSNEVTLTAYLGGSLGVEDVTFDVVAPEGWTVERTGDAVEVASLGTEETASATFVVTAPEDAPYYNPYRRNVHPFRASGDVYGVVGFERGGQHFETTVDAREVIGVLPTCRCA